MLYEGTNENNTRYSVAMVVYPTGGFKLKGGLRQWIASKRSMKVEDLTPEQLRKHRVRNKDRMWFNLWLGKEYMRGKEVHHNENGYCFVLTVKEHREGKHEQYFWE